MPIPVAYTMILGIFTAIAFIAFSKGTLKRTDRIVVIIVRVLLLLMLTPFIVALLLLAL